MVMRFIFGRVTAADSQIASVLFVKDSHKSPGLPKTGRATPKSVWRQKDAFRMRYELRCKDRIKESVHESISKTSASAAWI